MSSKKYEENNHGLDDLDLLIISYQWNEKNVTNGQFVVHKPRSAMKGIISAAELVATKCDRVVLNTCGRYPTTPQVL